MTCTTAKKLIDVNAETPASYIGQQGLKRTTQFHDHAVESLWTAIDLAQSRGLYHSNDKFTGYFKAPATEDYRFIMACDDGCSFKMSIDDPLNPDALQPLLERYGHTTFRNSDIGDKTESDDNDAYGKSFSEWVSLTKDEYYYVEATLAQGGGEVHINIGMEIRATPANAEHPKLEAQV